MTSRNHFAKRITNKCNSVLLVAVVLVLLVWSSLSSSLSSLTETDSEATSNNSKKKNNNLSRFELFQQRERQQACLSWSNSSILNHPHNSSNATKKEEGSKSRYFWVASSHPNIYKNWRKPPPPPPPLGNNYNNDDDDDDDEDDDDDSSNNRDMIKAGDVVSFIFYRQRKNQGKNKDFCSATIFAKADAILHELHNNDTTNNSNNSNNNNSNSNIPPLSQSAFLQVVLDHRFIHYTAAASSKLSTNRQPQTRRTEITVREVAPDFFFFSTTFHHAGITVLSLQVAFETITTASSSSTSGGSHEDQERISLDTVGSDVCQSMGDKDATNAAVLQRVRFRGFDTVTRLGILVQTDPSTDNVDNRRCDYSTGYGEWVYEFLEKETTATATATAATTAATATATTLSSSSSYYTTMKRLPQEQETSAQPQQDEQLQLQLQLQQHLSVLFYWNDIAQAPFSPAVAAPGKYRLFSCSEETLERDYQRGKARLSRPLIKSCSVGDSNFRILSHSIQELGNLPNFFNRPYKYVGQHRSSNNNSNTTKQTTPVIQVPILQQLGKDRTIFRPMRYPCGDKKVQVLFYGIGSHCANMNLPHAVINYQAMLSNIKSDLKTKCVVGVDIAAPYSKQCPVAKFGWTEHLIRNVWRDWAKNHVARQFYQTGGALTAGLFPMELSARDVAMVPGDCVHYANGYPFHVYQESAKFLLALVGRDCTGF